MTKRTAATAERFPQAPTTLGRFPLVILELLIMISCVTTATNSASQTAYTNLYTTLLTNYDKNVLPDNATVQVGLNVHKVLDVNIQMGSMSINAWLRLQWIDNRLAWTPSDHNNISLLTVRAQPMPRTDSGIWTPDIELENMETTIGESFPSNKGAMVYSDGSVFWSRPGVLKSLCKFKGLYNFPFDTLICVLEFGAWSTHLPYMDLVPRSQDGGAIWSTDPRVLSDSITSGTASSSSFNTAGALYKDYEIKSIDVHQGKGYYDCCPDEPWPKVHFTFELERYRDFYVWTLLAPQIIMAFLSFGQYFLSPGCGERMGFGITLLLAIQATNLIAAAHLPIASGMVIDPLNHTCFMFCAISLAESMVVMWLYHQTEAWKTRRIFYGLPLWLQPWCGCLRRCVAIDNIEHEHEHEDEDEDEVKCNCQQCTRHESDMQQRCSDKVQPIQAEQSSWCSWWRRSSQVEPKVGPEKKEPGKLKSVHQVREEINLSQLFLSLDRDSNECIDLHEISKFGKYMLTNWQDSKLKKRCRDHMNNLNKGGLDKNDFFQMMTEVFFDSMQQQCSDKVQDISDQSTEVVSVDSNDHQTPESGSDKVQDSSDQSTENVSLDSNDQQTPESERAYNIRKYQDIIKGYQRHQEVAKRIASEHFQTVAHAIDISFRILMPLAFSISLATIYGSNRMNGDPKLTRG